MSSITWNWVLIQYFLPWSEINMHITLPLPIHLNNTDRGFNDSFVYFITTKKKNNNNQKHKTITKHKQLDKQKKSKKKQFKIKVRKTKYRKKKILTFSSP